jgi:hypothetical protein
MLIDVILHLRLQRNMQHLAGSCPHGVPLVASGFQFYSRTQIHDVILST